MEQKREEVMVTGRWFQLVFGVGIFWLFLGIYSLLSQVGLIVFMHETGSAVPILSYTPLVATRLLWIVLGFLVLGVRISQKWRAILFCGVSLLAYGNFLAWQYPVRDALGFAIAFSLAIQYGKDKRERDFIMFSVIAVWILVFESILFSLLFRTSLFTIGFLTYILWGTLIDGCLAVLTARLLEKFMNGPNWRWAQWIHGFGSRFARNVSGLDDNDYE